jgi:hypothetical protein
MEIFLSTKLLKLDETKGGCPKHEIRSTSCLERKLVAILSCARS